MALPDLPTNHDLISQSFVHFPTLYMHVNVALKMNTANPGLQGPFVTKPVGVYSIHNTNSGDSSVGGDSSRGNAGALQKSAGRKPTPANPYHVDHGGPLHHHNIQPLPPTIEVNEVDSSDDGRDPSVALSPAAQVHSLSLFLSSSTSDSGKADAIYNVVISDSLNFYGFGLYVCLPLLSHM